MKKILLCILSVLIICLVYNRLVVQFVWVNPNVNTKVLPHIAKVIKEIDKALNESIRSMHSEQMDIKIVYKNAYGSGFLKNNPIPNDLDYSIGVYLGKYEFDGTNAKAIAQSIDEKMTIFQTEFYTYLNMISNTSLYSNYNTLSAIKNLNNKRYNNIESVSKTIPELFNHKEHITYSDKILEDENKNEIHLTFPFVLKENELLIEDYSPILLYSNAIKYDKNTRDMLREITIVTDFYVDIQKGDDIINAEIVAESFSGQRLQLTRRFFVPIVFVSNSSANYLKHLSILQDDDKYLEYRLFNFKRHLQEFSNLKEMQERPIKLFKRVLQCTDLILPVLDANTVDDINSTISKNLNNPKIQLINDYQTAFSNLIQITMMPSLYLKAQYNNEVTKHVNSMIKITDEMKALNQFKPEEIALLEKTNSKLQEDLKMLNSEYKLRMYTQDIIQISTSVFEMLDNIVKASTSDKEKILGYVETFNKIMRNAGFHKIDICWLNNTTIGVVKDEFTSTIPVKELKQMAKENNLADVDYKFINRAELSGPKVRYAVWVRYNSTDKENQNWELMKSQLLQDKKNFNIKRNFVFLIK